MRDRHAYSIDRARLKVLEAERVRAVQAQDRDRVFVLSGAIAGLRTAMQANLRADT